MIVKMKTGQNSRIKSIGVFDSGFGGVDILRGIVKELPQFSYVYLGDTARVPYGSRQGKEIYEFTKQAVDFLFSHDCELVVIACNTASSVALRKIQQEYLSKEYPRNRVLGVLIPAVEEAVITTRNNRVGVIGTEATINSDVFKVELQKINPKIKVFQKACPLLVPVVESGDYDSPATRVMLKKYLNPLMAENIDTLILGCTHYGILEKHIKKIVGQNVGIISEARIVPVKLKDYLKRHKEIEKKIRKDSKVTFYSTKLNSGFEKLGSKFFGKKIKALRATLG